MKKIRLMLAVLACLIGTLCHEASAATTYPELYVRGAFTGSWAAQADYKLERNGNVYSRTFASLPAGQEFKIGSGEASNWGYSYSSGKAEMVANTDYTCDSGDNMSLKEELKNVTVKFDYTNALKPTLTFEVNTEPQSPRTVYVVNNAEWSNVGLYMWEAANNNNKNGEWPGAKLTEKLGKSVKVGDKTYDDVYVYTIAADKTYDKIIVNDNVKTNGNQTSNLSIADGNLYVVQKGTHDDTDDNGKTVSRQNCDVVAKGSYSIVETVIPEPTYPELYLRGNLSDWEAIDMYKLNRSGSVYSRKFSSLPAGKFKIASKTANAGGWEYAYSTGNMSMVANKEYTCGKNHDNSDMGLASALTDVTVTFDYSDPNAPKLTFTTEGGVTEHPNRIYMSFGRDRIYDGNRNKAPRVKLLTSRVYAESVPEANRNHGITLTTNDFNNAKEMIKAEINGVTPEDSPLWYVDLTDAEIASTKDLVFFFEPGSGFNNSATDANYWQYLASRSVNWDFDNWTKFIYFADNEKAAQSYMTFAQYEAVCKADKTELYVVGNGFAGLHGWSVVPTGAIPDRVEDLTDAACMILKASNGVFYQTLVKDEANLENSTPDDGTGDQVGDKKVVKGANFKMSWIRPVVWYIRSGKSGGAMDSQRAWATFNLGIVGYDRNHPAIVSGQIPVVRGTANALNSEVYCSPCRTIPMNNYNQANWFVRQSFMDNHYTLVVDVHDGSDADDGDCMTVTLLPFAPQPTLSGVTVEIQPMILTPEQSELVYANSDRLQAETGSGKVLFTKVNKAVATATIKIADDTKYEGDLVMPDGSSVHYNFSHVYEIYSDSVRVGTYAADRSTSAKIVIDGIAYGNSSTLGIRTRYTDATSYNGKDASGLSFHTRFSESVVNTDFELPQPQAEVIRSCYSPGSTNTLDDPDLTKRGYTLGAYAEVKVTAPDLSGLSALGGDMAWYADFSLAPDGASHYDEHPYHDNGGEVVHSAHPAKTVIPDAKYLEYNPWAEGAAYGENNNWSAMLTSAEVWPLNLPDVVEVQREYKYGNNWQFDEAEPKVTVKGAVRAVYPFVVDTNSTITLAPADSPAAPARRADARAAAPDYKLILKPSGDSNVSFSLDGGSLTAVRDLIAPEAVEGEAEYYNLQGVRMSGELAPGIYVRRQGARAEKVVVR